MAARIVPTPGPLAPVCCGCLDYILWNLVLSRFFDTFVVMDSELSEYLIGMYFSIEIPLIALLLLAILFVLTIVLVTIYRSRLYLTVKCRSKCEGEAVADVASPVSVVVYARDNARRLALLLDQLLSQEYAPGYEVIVVNDNGGYDVDDVVTRFALGHNNLRSTFVPGDAHNLSRRKLAITLGLKSARHQRVLLLNAECSLPSVHWLSGMVSRGGSLILGQAVISPDGDSETLPLMARLSEADTAITWIGAALRGRAYRGNGYNMGYDTKLFFDNGGFSGTLNLQAGDDDLFVYKVARQADVKVVLSSDTIVNINTSRPRKLYSEVTVSHMFTGRQLPRHPLMWSAPLSMWLSLAVAVAAPMLAWPNLTVLVVAFVLLVLQWLVTAMAWGKASAAVGVPIAPIKALLAMFWLPVYRLGFRWAVRRNRSQHFTWQNNKRL
ncbi:MAG: hypothetical protein NC082_09480 [Clostridiales bacterium]|nr:hypothetical protein [Clostridiales bacterium]